MDMKKILERLREDKNNVVNQLAKNQEQQAIEQEKLTKQFEDEIEKINQKNIESEVLKKEEERKLQIQLDELKNENQKVIDEITHLKKM